MDRINKYPKLNQGIVRDPQSIVKVNPSHKLDKPIIQQETEQNTVDKEHS